MNRRAFFLLIGAILLAAELRIAAIDAQSLWYDEELAAGRGQISIQRIRRAISF